MPSDTEQISNGAMDEHKKVQPTAETNYGYDLIGKYRDNDDDESDEKKSAKKLEYDNQISQQIINRFAWSYMFIIM